VKIKEAEEKVRETIVAIRKVFTNKKWCKWADEWLSGTDRTAASAESVAKEMARPTTKATASGRPPSRAAILKSPAGNAALAAAILARSSGGEIDPFASMMLEGYLKKDEPSAIRNKKDR
jgi:hypothetical protein